MIAAILGTTVALVATAEPASEPRTTVALVVTNNRSLDPSRPNLHYADDDGLQYAELLLPSAGERLVVLTELDAETSALHPSWRGRVRPPTLTNLESAVVDAAALLDANCATVVENGPTGEGPVSVTFDGKIGKITDVEVGAPFAGTPVEQCIKRSFIGEYCLPFEGDPKVVKYTVNLPAKAAPAAPPKKK